MRPTVEDLVESGLVSLDVPLGPLTTYKAGGPARFMAEVGDQEDLERLIDSGLTREQPLLVIGRGSNLVVADHGFPGLVIRLGEGFAGIEFDDDRVGAGGAVPLPRLARASVDHGLSGLEFFVGVPGSVGGAVRQNAGCFGTETRECLIEAVVVDLHTGTLSALTPTDLDLSYRHSILEPHQMVTIARFAGHRGDIVTAREQIRVITRWRKENQPGGTLNAGSVFKNPAHITAGELIDSLGLKGLGVGDVAVSTKHANFFVAGQGAKTADIYRLVQLVKDRVFELSGTKLEPEIQFVGFEE
jgi:UDP-N-acetylmuramate dehydrogenase